MNKEGAVCLDILKDKWSPALTAAKVMLALLSLLKNANPEHPLDADIAKLYKDDRETHDNNAREWTEKYAIPQEDES